MDELKKLEEERDQLYSEMENALEERDFDSYDEKEKEVTAIEKKIELIKRQNITDTPIDENRDEDEENIEIRDILNHLEETGKEISVSDYELRDGEMVIGGTTGSQKSTGNIAKTTFANYIIKKAEEISPLFGACRKEVLSAKTHAIPIQKTKLGNFVSTKELAKYVAQNADYDQIKLEATKYTNLVVFSEELLEDTGYDIEGDIKEQILESYAKTMDELIVKGDSDQKVEGLNSFDISKGAKEVVQKEAGVITTEELNAMYYSLKSMYRNNATWVFSTEVAQYLSNLKDSIGRPLLTASFNNSPFGSNSELMGRPVIINDHIAKMTNESKSIFFGDLQRALVIGPRKSFTLQKSTEFGFIQDSIAIKANVRLDIKTTLQEAMCYYKCIE